jgi:ferrous iron transport protein B
MQLNHSKLSKKKTQALNATIDSLKLRMNAERQMNSYIGRIGEYLYPVFKPLGFDWRMGISLLTGVAAKEIVISTMGVLFQVDTEIGESSETLIHKLRTAEYMRGPNEGQPVFTPLVAFAYLVFVLIYFPCIGVIATIKRESGSWKWALFTMFYTTGLAWLASFLIYNVGSLIA